MWLAYPAPGFRNRGICWSLVKSSVSNYRPLGIQIFFSLLAIYIYAIFMGDTMYHCYLFVQAVRPVSHYAIMMFQLGFMISVNVLQWS